MELDLLRRRAEKIPGSNFSDEGLNDEFRLLPNESFSCNGVMTGLLLVVTILNVGEKYPEIQIWRNTGGSNYTRQASEEIRLNPGDFSPDGVLQYNLTTHMSFQSGDVLGVYQPFLLDSVLRVYWQFNSTSVTYKNSFNPLSPINVLNLPIMTSEKILISPITTG